MGKLVKIISIRRKLSKVNHGYETPKHALIFFSLASLGILVCRLAGYALRPRRGYSLKAHELPLVGCSTDKF
jgi:hypothetical protein